MGVVRTYQWKLRCTADDAVRFIRAALGQAGFEASVTGMKIDASSKMSWTKNRYSATLSAVIAAAADGAAASWTVEMAGSKHHEVLGEVAMQLPEGVLDDRGLSAAMDRLGKPGRLFGRRELAQLANMIYADERVVQLGQGLLDKKQGIVVLTNERLFFFEKSGLMGESLVQFDVGAIQALSVGKGWGGERLEVAHAGMKTEIKQMGPGQADGLIAAFREVKRAPASPPPIVYPAAAAGPTAGPDPVEQMQQLKRMAEAGLITE